MKTQRLVWMVLCVSLAVACGKGDKSKKAESGSAAGDSAASAPVAVSYRAFGNEPFWSVTINADGLHFVAPADSAGIHFPPVEPMAMGDTLHWSATSDRGKIDVRIWPGQCSDDMSDQAWSYTSGVRLNEMVYTGCGERMMGAPVR